MQSALQLRGAGCSLAALVNISAQIPGCEQEAGRKFGLQKRNQDAFWLLEGALLHYCQWVPMALFSSWEKQKIDLLSYLRTWTDLCGRLKMSSSLGKAGRCCVHSQSKPNHEQFAFTQPLAQGVVQVLGSWWPLLKFLWKCPC